MFMVVISMPLSTIGKIHYLSSMRNSQRGGEMANMGTHIIREGEIIVLFQGRNPK